MFKRICVYCGSRKGAQPAYAAAAKTLGGALARRGIELVYGGGRVGLMGVVAEATLAGGGKVIGVIPKKLVSKEVAFLELQDLRIMKTMHERKALMEELSDGFIALPGGVGTFEEFFEMITWSVLGLHRKPVGLLNIEGYYDGLLKFLDHAVAEDFMKAKLRESIVVETDPERMIDALAAVKLPRTEKIISLKDA